MSSEDYEIFRAMDQARKALRAKYALPCVQCVVKLPKANATLLLPGQRCRIHNHVDTRPRIPDELVDEVFKQFGITRTKHDRNHDT